MATPTRYSRHDAAMDEWRSRMASQTDSRPEDVRALKAAAACRAFGGSDGRRRSAELTGLVGSENLGALLAATHRVEAWLGLKHGSEGR